MRSFLVAGSRSRGVFERVARHQHPRHSRAHLLEVGNTLPQGAGSQRRLMVNRAARSLVDVDRMKLPLLRAGLLYVSFTLWLSLQWITHVAFRASSLPYELPFVVRAQRQRAHLLRQPDLQ